MEFTEPERNAIKKRVAKSLKRTWVGPYEGNNSFWKRPQIIIDLKHFPWQIDQIVKAVNGKAQQNKFIEMFGLFGPLDIIREQVSLRIWKDNWDKDFEYCCTLDEYLPAEEFQLLAEKITQEIESYPREYHVFLDMPSIEAPQESFQISPTEYVEKVTSQFEAHYPFQANGGIVGAVTPESRLSPRLKEYWQKGQTYVRLSIKGFFTQREGLNFNVLCLDRVYSLLGLAIATGLLEKNDKKTKKLPPNESTAGPHYGLIVFENRKEKTALFIDTIPIPYNQRLKINTLEIDPSGNEKLVALAKLLYLENTRVEYANAVKQILGASRWLFDCVCEDNQTHAFVLAMVGLEIILGKKDKETGITEKLADRLAYLLAPNAALRETIYNQFKSLYSKRGSIVHRGAAILPDKDIADLAQVTNFLSMAIAKETQQLISIPSH